MQEISLEAPALTPEVNTAATAHTGIPGDCLIAPLWGEPNNAHFIATLEQSIFRNEPAAGVGTAVERAALHSLGGRDTFFAPAEFKSPESRKADNVLRLRAFFFDIDCGEAKAAAGKGYITPEAGKVELDAFCREVGLPEPTHIVESGGGLHVYWVLDDYLDVADWKIVAMQLKDLTKARRFLADPTRTADPSSVLRVPGTYNFKYTPPVLVKLVRANPPLRNADVVDAIRAAHERLLPAPAPKPETPIVASEGDGVEVLPGDFSSVKRLVDQTNPDCGYDVWIKVLMGIFHETAGSAEGLQLAIDWSSRGKTFKGADDVKTHWQSFRLDFPNPVTKATLFALAAESVMNEPFEVVPIEVCDASAASVQAPLALVPATAVPVLARYSLRGMAAEIEREMIEEVPFLGNLALMGQASVIFAAPNTGKTLITLHLLMEDIKHGRLDPAKLYYVNVDDSGKGLAAKLHAQDEYSFNMLVNGRRGFKKDALPGYLTEMTTKGTAKGVVVVLDTLTKFVDTMDKARSREFSDVVREFVGAGGTLIALAHVNKKLDAEGKPTPAGTTDIRDNFDCAHIMWAPLDQPDGELRFVELECIKGRSCSIPDRPVYKYVKGQVGSYTERLLTVAAVEPEDFLTVQREQRIFADAVLIEAAKACIAEGIVQKITLSKAIAEKTGATGREAVRLLERYTGTDPATAFWRFDVKARGAKVFELLQPAV